MIAKVEIENYQSHKKTAMEFVPGTNVIIGESDAGKSAIFRAINWICNNRPMGDAFRSEWGGNTRVIIHTVEGDTIERVRTASKNEYRVNGRVLTAFGHDVPEEVMEILRTDSANIQDPADPPFLLAISPGEAARMLNRAASLTDIDSLTSALKKNAARIESDIKYNHGQLKDYAKQIKQYENIPALELELQKIEEAEEEFREKQKNALTLKRTVRRGEEINVRLKKTKHVPRMWDEYIALERNLSEYHNKAAAQKRFAQAVSRANELIGLLEDTEDIERAAPVLEMVADLLLSWEEKKKRANTLRQIFLRGRKSAETFNEVQKEIRRAEKEYKELTAGLELCPLCGSKMTD